MNPFTAWTVFSYRKELTYVALTFLVVLLLPLVAVIILTQTGINIISDTLVEVDEVSQEVEIKDPLDGSTNATVSGPFIWPTDGIITLEFGKSSTYQALHTGIDIAGKRGEAVTPFYPGTVIYAGQISWGYGKHIIIDHGNNMTSIYAHLDSMYVVPGQKVNPGDIIGGQGNTGWTVGPTGVHLHFQINVYGIPVNPRVFIEK
jgi:murein DD-endopeptidase MepM/ murein hydrolase activator NlpD